MGCACDFTGTVYMTQVRTCRSTRRKHEVKLAADSVCQPCVWSDTYLAEFYWSAPSLLVHPSLSDWQRFNPRLRDHFHRPDRGRTHVHRRPEISIHVPRFRSAEPISLALVNHVVQPPSRAVSLVAHPFAQQKSGKSKAGSYPDFKRLFVFANDRSIRSHAIGRAHFAATKLHHVEVEYFSGRRQLHFVRHQIAQARHIGIPLSGQLIGLHAVAVFAICVVAEVLAIPKLPNVCLLGFEK